VKHSELTHIELLRVQEFMASTGRTFDITLVAKKGDSITLSGIDKDEYRSLMFYFREKKLRVRNMDDDGKVMDLDNIDDGSPKKRRSMAEIDGADIGDAGDGEGEEESEDESFKDDADVQDLESGDESVEPESD